MIAIREQQRVPKPVTLSEDTYEELSDAQRAEYDSKLAAYRKWFKEEQERCKADEVIAAQIEVRPLHRMLRSAVFSPVRLLL